MKRFLSLLLVGLLAVSFVACTDDTTTAAETTAAETTAADETTAAETTAADEAFIALITDVGNIDDKSFNEGAWNGVKQYGDEFDVDYAYYRPTEDSDAARIETIEAAIAAGATVVVCPGYLFETAIYSVQGDYPEVSFLLLDGEPHTADYTTYETLSNTTNILYQEEQAGYLAGYAAVQEGYTQLGYVGGMAVPAVVRFGFGFVQGVEAAATELSLTNVELKYYYSNVFWPDPDLETKMDTWYGDGTEIVFACGGSLYESVVNAAERTVDGMVIGVDVDQSAESERILTSAMKGLTVSVYDALTAYFANDMAWPTELAGMTRTLGATTDGIGLPTNDTAWRFENFTVTEYEAIFAKLVDGTVVVDNQIAEMPTVTTITLDVQE